MKLFTGIRSMPLVILLASFSVIADIAPNFKVQSLSGDDYEFTSDSLDQAHLIVFWASWCRECRYEFAPLSALNNVESDRLKIVGVSIDKELHKAKEMAAAAGLPYLNVHDFDASIAEQFGVIGTPTMLLISSSGEVVHRAYRLDESFMQHLENTLSR